MSKAQDRDLLYRAAWRACGGTFPHTNPPTTDLRERLTDLLSSGWTIQAIEAFAYAQFTSRRFDHVTPAAWRWAVYFASLDGSREGPVRAATFLKEFNARQEQHTSTSDQAVGMSA